MEARAAAVIAAGLARWCRETARLIIDTAGRLGRVVARWIEEVTGGKHHGRAAPVGSDGRGGGGRRAGADGAGAGTGAGTGVSGSAGAGPSLIPAMAAMARQTRELSSAMARLASAGDCFALGVAALDAQAAGGGSGPQRPQFAPGGLVGWPASSAGPGGSGAPRGWPGMPGFGGTGELDYALGPLSGLRWWQLAVPPGTGVRAGRSWDFTELAERSAWLSGSFKVWQPGWNLAHCNQFPEEHEEQVPFDDGTGRACGCGWWVYWTVDGMPPPLGAARWDVLGAVEADGKVVIGPLGCRCRRARIVAVHLATGLAPRGGDPDAGERAAVEEVWRSSVEMALERRYGVRAYPTAAAMLLDHPPTADYLPAPDRAVPAWRAKPRIPRDGGHSSVMTSGGGLPGGRSGSQPDRVAYARRLFGGLHPGGQPAPSHDPGWVPVQDQPAGAVPGPDAAPAGPGPVTPIDAMGLLMARRHDPAEAAGGHEPGR
jgi:hypothetical protein